MAKLTFADKKFFEDIFEMKSGYILDYSNATFDEFFRETVGINIYDDKYSYNGGSKAKRLRAFWEIEADETVGRVLKELLEIWKYNKEKEGKDVKELYQRGLKIVNRLLNEKYINSPTKDVFLKKKFIIDTLKLNLSPEYLDIIEQRINEIEICLKNDAPLAAIFLCGSVLEGLLLSYANKYPKIFNSAKSAPKDKSGEIKKFQNWTLNNFIDVAYEIGIFGLDVKKYSQSLREFRNYIHPNEQLKSKFKPDKNTAAISWQVLKAAITNLSEMEKKLIVTNSNKVRR